MGRRDRVNRNGERLCNAYGCRKHKELLPLYGTQYCKAHLEIAIQIRQQINHISTKFTRFDFEARLQEVAFRKDADLGHVNYIFIMAQPIYPELPIVFFNFRNDQFYPSGITLGQIDMNNFANLTYFEGLLSTRSVNYLA